MLEQVRLEERLATEPLSPELLLEAKRNGLSDARIGVLTERSEAEVEAMREDAGIPASYPLRRHLCRGVRGEHAVFLLHLGRGGRRRAVRRESGDHPCERSEPDRAGARVRYLLHPRLARLPGSGSEDDHHQLQPRDGFNRFQHLRPALHGAAGTRACERGDQRREESRDVVVQLGGQTPLNMAEELERGGATDHRDLGRRASGCRRPGVFSQSSSAAGSASAEKPDGGNSPDEVVLHTEEIGFPVLLRPSFVLGGRSMFIAFNREELADFLSRGVP